MIRKQNTIYILFLSAFILFLNGCKTSNLIQCPDFAKTGKVHATFALGLHIKHSEKSAKPADKPVSASLPENTAPELAAATADMKFKIKMPNAFAQSIEDDKQLADMNKLLANYSGNKVSLQRNDKGKILLRAHSVKDILALAKNANQPRGYYEKRYGGGGNGDNGATGSATASVVLGPIGFVFAFLPILSFIAIPISIAAIVTGAIGIRSSRRRLASIGLTFGILGLILSILFSIFWVSFWWILLF